MRQLTLRGFDDAGAFELPEFDSFSASFEFSDIGAMTLSYPTNGVNADRIYDNAEIALLCNGVEVDNGRWIVVAIEGDENPNQVDLIKAACRSNHSIFENTIVLGTDPDAPTKVTFADKTPGFILNYLFTQAQARGAMTGFTFSSFSATQTTDAEAWAQNYTIEYKPGVKYIEILRQLVDKGLIEYKIVGRDIQVFNIDQLGVDRTLESPPVVLRSGRDFSEAPFKRTVDNYASDVVVEGDNSSFVRDQDATTHPYGRQEVYVTQAGTSDPGTLAIIADSTLSLRAEPRMEKTRKIEISQETEFFPILDYMPSDYVYHVASSEPERLRIRMLTVQIDKNGLIDGSLVLNDKLLEADIIQARRIEGILNGSTSSPNGPPAGSYTDYTIPQAPTIATVTSTQYAIKSGTPQAAVTITVTLPTLNTDNSLCTDLAFTAARWRYDEAGFPTEWNDVRGVSGNDVTFSGVATSADIEIEAAVIDSSNHVSAWSATVSHTTAEDTTPPPAPVAPSVVTKLGNVVLSWDGTFAASAARPEDFSHVEIYVHTSSIGDPPTGATLVGTMDQKSSMVLSSLSYNQLYYFRMFAIDKSGNRSVGSASASVTNIPLVRTDIGAGSITYNEIPFKDSGNIIQDGSFHSSVVRELRLTASSGGFNFGGGSNGNYYPYFDETGIVALTGMVDVIEGTKYYIRGLFKKNSAANGIIKLTIAWYNGTDTAWTFWNYTTTASANDVWEQKETTVTVPTGALGMYIYMQTTSQTTGFHYADNIECRLVIPTALIDDAAITNAKIQDASINTAKINSLSASKIEAGTITADKISLSVMQSNLIRNSTFDENIPFNQADSSYTVLVPSLHSWTQVALDSGTGGTAQLHTDSTTKRSGRTSLTLTKYASKNGVYAESEEFNVIPTKTYHFGGYACIAYTPNPQIRYALYLYDGSTWSETVKLTETISALYSAPHKSEFSHYMPAGTTKAKLRIYNYQGSSSQTAVRVEDVYALEEGVGAVIQSPYGIKMFGGTGEETINLNASTSSIVGATISTASSGNKVVIEEDGDLGGAVKFYSGHLLESEPGALSSGFVKAGKAIGGYERTSNVAKIKTTTPGLGFYQPDDTLVVGDIVTVDMDAVNSSFSVVDAVVTAVYDSGKTFAYANTGSNVTAVYNGSGINDTWWEKKDSEWDAPFIRIAPPQSSATPEDTYIDLFGSRDVGYLSEDAINMKSKFINIDSNLIQINTEPSTGSFVLDSDSISVESDITEINKGRGYVSLGEVWDSVRAPGVYNTTNVGGANVTIHSNGIVTRSTSSIRYKFDVVEIGEASLADVIPEGKLGGIHDKDPMKILDVAPVLYRADNERPETEGLSRIGFIAEDIAAKMPGVETRNAEGEVEAFDMNQIVASILAVVQKHEKVLNNNNLE